MLLIGCQGVLLDRETRANGREANNDICKYKKRKFSGDNDAARDALMLFDYVLEKLTMLVLLSCQRECECNGRWAIHELQMRICRVRKCLLL